MFVHGFAQCVQICSEWQEIGVEELKKVKVRGANFQCSAVFVVLNFWCARHCTSDFLWHLAFVIKSSNLFISATTSLVLRIVSNSFDNSSSSQTKIKPNTLTRLAWNPSHETVSMKVGSVHCASSSVAIRRATSSIVCDIKHGSSESRHSNNKLFEQSPFYYTISMSMKNITIMNYAWCLMLWCLMLWCFDAWCLTACVRVLLELLWLDFDVFRTRINSDLVHDHEAHEMRREESTYSFEVVLWFITSESQQQPSDGPLVRFGQQQSPRPRGYGSLTSGVNPSIYDIIQHIVENKMVCFLCLFGCVSLPLRWQVLGITFGQSRIWHVCLLKIQEHLKPTHFRSN